MEKTEYEPLSEDDAVLEEQSDTELKDELAVDVTEAEPTKPRRLWPLILLLGAFLGFGASFAASWFIRPTAPTFDDRQIQKQIAGLQTDIGVLREDLRAIPTTQPAQKPVDFGPQTARLEAIEQRLDALAEAQAMPINADLVERMEALQKDGFEMPEPVVLPDFPDFDALEARLAALEAKFAAVETTAPTAPQEKIYAPEDLPAFPADRLREGALQLAGGGLIKRTFSRHVRVRDENDPMVLIDAVELAMAEGRAGDAIAQFDQLPSQLRSLAQAWRADMEPFIR